MRHDYLVKNPLLFLYLKILSFLFFFIRKKEIKKKKPKKILLINLAHKGDVIISTSALPFIKKKYPKAQIGFLVGSWSKEILENHPAVNFIHIYDHPKLNRSKISIFYKCWQGFKSFKSALKSIKKKSYDISIDLYLYYPNSHFLTWMCNIPTRIGYITGGGEQFLTKCFQKKGHLHMSSYTIKLLAAIDIKIPEQEFFKPLLPDPGLSSPSSFKGCWIFHPYSGNKLKDCKESYWRDLALDFIKNGKQVVFTGSSLEEKQKIDKIIEKIDGCVNLATKLSFEDLKKIVKEATGIICVDTMIGHLAAAYDIKSFVIYSKYSDSQLWRPASKESADL